jgi:hypothetical protein
VPLARRAVTRRRAHDLSDIDFKAWNRSSEYIYETFPIDFALSNAELAERKLSRPDMEVDNERERRSSYTISTAIMSWSN